nr:HD domain-containing protein [Saprospiraceae bacterium]
MGLKAYLVGGYVRDKILGRNSVDMDILCVGNGIQLAEGVCREFDDCKGVTVFKRFGTAMLKTGDLEVEFVGARKESYSEDSRKPQVQRGTLKDDLLRRDFTINALAVKIEPTGLGEMVDMFDGVKDLESEVIRTPVDPAATFSDDPLRMLRAIRFATQLNFEIHPTTYEGIVDSAERLKIISTERITSELQKIMESPKPSIGFILLNKCGLLQLILPEITALKGAETRDGIGHKDNFYHTLEVLDRLSKNSDHLWLRWAALLHDVGKPATKRFEEGHGWTFHGHEVVGARMVPKIFRRLRMSTGKEMRYVKKLVALHLRPISLTNEEASDSAVRRLLFDAGEDIEDLLLLCEADITSKNPDKVKRFLENYTNVRQRIREVEERDRIRNWQPPITGDIIMKTFGIKPSEKVGIIKESIKDAILDGDIPNDKQAAFDLMIKKGKSLGLKPTDE